ncbi:AcrR family transcriptional regulator [Catenulispora sp. GAS73]|uniref:TetR/AcrR family transcriptional regulator n=1 Tax=Catenulispora sp. GAS73 TaxID=3156269 RepID=UPI003514B75A
MPTSAPTANRFEKRRAETRQALIRAARQILAESGDTSASIQAIAERADVGFGSFYNHFESKADLFDAAVADALDEYGSVVDELLHGVEDPAERVAGGVRISVRLAGSHPEIVQILRHRGLAHIYTDRGLAERALKDVELGIATGRFTVTDPIVALSALGGSLLALLELGYARPDADFEQTAQTMAELMLRMLGVPADEAHDVARHPYPGSAN